MSNTAEVTLDTPIPRATPITTITLHKPNAGALKGVSIRAVLDMEDDTIRRLVLRVADPKLTQPEVNDMDPADVMQAGIKLAGFFMPREILKDTIAQDSPTE